MKKHGLLLILSASLLTLAACGGTPAASSEQSSEPSASIPSQDSSIPSQESSEEPKAEAANGAFSYVYEDYAERTKILAALEKYAVETRLTGLTLFGDGGYIMYNPVVVKGSNNYINGYGFGILPEGELVGDLAGETNPKYARYLHTYETDDPGKINYMNDTTSVVGDLQPYVSASYFDTQMNETKDGYDWVGDFSLSDRPIAVDPDEYNLAKTYKFPVKVGSQLKYSTTSEKKAAWNNREVQLEDYITPYKIYYTKAYAMARGNENLDGAGSIAGSRAYYEASSAGFNADAWKNIGIKAYVDPADGKSYLEFTFNTPCNRFYAMYYLNNSMFAPVPAEFIEEIGGGDFATGVANWGVATDDESIVDHWLCTGPYQFERWDTGDQIIFQKNPNYADRGRYKIQGIHVNILAAAKEDNEAAFKEFLANKLHSAGIPSTQLEDYRNDPRTVMTSDSSTYKINMNVCDQETWDKLFPGGGWKCEPAMSNSDFTAGLSYALDRKTFADTYGRTPSGNYFGNGYMSDPENGIVYNDTQEHKDAVASILEGTDGYGFSLEKAKASFVAASETLIEEGVYNPGETIEIEIAWQTEAQADTQGATVKTMLESAFNTEENPLTLNVVSWVGADWTDVYYEKMMVGKYDLGFGSVSGNPLNPLNFLEVLKSDNSSGFTLNWGVDTSVPSEDLVYDGKYWSFDALWTAADRGAYVEDGEIAPLFYTDIDNATVTMNQDGSATFSTKVREMLVQDGDEIAALGIFYAACIYGHDGTQASYEEAYVTIEDEENCKVTEIVGDPFWNAFVEVTFDAETVQHYNAKTGGLGFDVYYAMSLCGSPLSLAYDVSLPLKPGSLTPIND